MKSLLIVRHAKSSWGDIELPDFDRPLNERGRKDAPEMARRLLENKIPIDAFISSPARRALKTAKLFCKEYNVHEKKLLQSEELYHASESTFYKVIATINDRYINVALFSHNPGITDFVNSLCNGIHIDNMPTCAVFAVKAKTNNWSEFKDAEKKFQFFEYPKKNE